MNSSQAEALVALLEAAYDEMPESKAALYRETLELYDFEDARDAVRWLIATYNFLPRIARLNEACHERARERWKDAPALADPDDPMRMRGPVVDLGAKAKELGQRLRGIGGTS